MHNNIADITFLESYHLKGSGFETIFSTINRLEVGGGGGGVRYFVTILQD